MTEVLRIGCGAGLANDRFDAAVELTENGNLDVLVLECLAERTIALGQTRELAEPGTGYDPTLERRIRSLLGPLAAHGTQLVTNLGSANPIAAGELVARVATDMGVAVRIAVLTGDDVFARIDKSAPAWEDGKPLTHGPLVSANAYLGVEQLLRAAPRSAICRMRLAPDWRPFRRPIVQAGAQPSVRRLPARRGPRRRADHRQDREPDVGHHRHGSRPLVGQSTFV